MDSLYDLVTTQNYREFLEYTHPLKVFAVLLAKGGVTESVLEEFDLDLNQEHRHIFESSYDKTSAFQAVCENRDLRSMRVMLESGRVNIKTLIGTHSCLDAFLLGRKESLSLSGELEAGVRMLLHSGVERVVRRDTLEVMRESSSRYVREMEVRVRE